MQPDRDGLKAEPTVPAAGLADQVRQVVDDLIARGDTSMKSLVRREIEAARDRPADVATQAELAEEIANAKLALWPIGSIFVATVATNPATLLGFGTWSAFGAGRVLVGLDSGDGDFDTAEETGGAKTVTLTEAQIPAHDHATDSGQNFVTQNSTAALGSGGTVRFIPQDGGATTADAGGGEAHPNVQPYIVVHMWKRTA